jgi:hypothetical protein
MRFCWIERNVRRFADLSTRLVKTWSEATITNAAKKNSFEREGPRATRMLNTGVLVG